MITPSDLIAIGAAFEHGRRVVLNRKHAAQPWRPWVDEPNRPEPVVAAPTAPIVEAVK